MPIERVCVSCRVSRLRENLIRLTVCPTSSKVALNKSRKGINGRSAYICPSSDCVNLALKGNKLKYALNGRQARAQKSRTNVFWPLESQLIKDILQLCTEAGKTCQNTRVGGK